MNETMTFEKKLAIGNIGYTFVPAISGYGARLYIQRGFGIATDLIKGLNALSIWGGYDKYGENFLSWEFGREMTEERLTIFCGRLLQASL